MSVIVRNMEMPISCAECPIGGSMRCALIPGVPAWCAEYDQCVEEKKLHSQCPLIPVPSHGDLIERKEAYDSLLSGMAMTGYQSRALNCINEIYVPTVIPANHSEGKK